MGRRIRDRVPGGHGKILTILGAMNHTGMLATMTVESATDGDVFRAFLDHVLCPRVKMVYPLQQETGKMPP